MVAPHDDDALLGMGGTLAAAIAGGHQVDVAIVTDGRMGYTDLETRGDLVAERRRETVHAFAGIGLSDSRLHWLDFPDGSLHLARGCRPDEEGGGMGRKLTQLIRQTRAGSVFCCTIADTHPDHRVTAEETEIASVWAGSNIWRELGEPIPPPTHWAYAVYRDFPGEPDVEVALPTATFEAKLSALACFETQTAISGMIDRIRERAPFEYFQRLDTEPYDPRRYRALFT